MRYNWPTDQVILIKEGTVCDTRIHDTIAFRDSSDDSYFTADGWWVLPDEDGHDICSWEPLDVVHSDKTASLERWLGAFRDVEGDLPTAITRDLAKRAAALVDSTVQLGRRSPYREQEPATYPRKRATVKREEEPCPGCTPVLTEAEARVIHLEERLRAIIALEQVYPGPRAGTPRGVWQYATGAHDAARAAARIAGGALR